MGYAFTFHVAQLVGGIPVGSYTHYPTVSKNMLARVSSRQKWHTNDDSISSSIVLSQGKLLYVFENAYENDLVDCSNRYYRLFMYYYSFSLRKASFIMVNSSWTKSHIDYALTNRDSLLEIIHLCTPLALITYFSSWGSSRSTVASRIVYPPCDTREMAKFSLEGRERVILSIAQFRYVLILFLFVVPQLTSVEFSPEKDHKAQLHAFQKLLDGHPEYSSPAHRVRLVLIGGSRNADDATRVEELKELAKNLNIDVSSRPL